MNEVLPNLVISFDKTNITDNAGGEKVVVRRSCSHPERSVASVMFAAASVGTL